MRFETIEVTPELAKKYLEKNTDNRRLNLKTVDVYAKEMRNGNWELTPQPIIINSKGVLTNGQHRLNAVIKSEKTIPMVFCFDADADISMIDNGLPRTPLQIAQIRNNIDSKLLNNKLFSVVRLYHVFFNNAGSNNKISVSEIEDFISKNSDDLLAVLEVKKEHRGLMNNAPAMLGLFVAIAVGNVDTETLKEFVQVVETGFYERKNQTSAVVLRNQLIEVKGFAGTNQGRKMILNLVQEAIYDYVRKYPRKQKYKGERGIYLDANDK